jgi:hypothetical protein
MLKFKSRLTAAAVLALTCLANGPAWAATSVTYVSGKAQMPALARHLQILAGRSNSQLIKRQPAARSRRSTPPIIAP